MLRSATSTAANLLGRTGQLGTLRPGAVGDVIAVDGDLLWDLAALEADRLALVMQDGTVRRDERASR